MSTIEITEAPLQHSDSFFIGGEWVEPSSKRTIDVIDSTTEEHYFSVPEALEPDMDRAIAAAREAFDHGPWRKMSHAERAGYIKTLAEELRGRADDIAQIWPRESGVTIGRARGAAAATAGTFDYYAGLADTFPFEEEKKPTAGGEFGLLVREPVGVVGAIIPWNGPLGLIGHKVAPALIAGCTIVLKSSPEAPGDAYVVAEAAAAAGLPPGVLNVITADREVSENLVIDPRIDKITFTGSTLAGRRIASLCGERIARVTLELGGKSAAVILDDADLEAAAASIAALRVPAHRPGLLVADPADRHREAPRRLRRGAQRGVLGQGRRRPVRRGHRDGAARRRAPARPGRGLHQERPGRGSDARHRRRPSRPPREGLVRRADRLRQRRQLARRSPARRSSARSSR